MINLFFRIFRAMKYIFSLIIRFIRFPTMRKMFTFKYLLTAFGDLIYKIAVNLLKFVDILRKMVKKDLTFFMFLISVLKAFQDRLPKFMRGVIIFLELITLTALISAALEMNAFNLQGLMNFIQSLYDEIFTYFEKSLENFQSIIIYIKNKIQSLIDFFYPPQIEDEIPEPGMNFIRDLEDNIPSSTPDVKNIEDVEVSNSNFMKYLFLGVLVAGLTVAGIYYFDITVTENLPPSVNQTLIQTTTTIKEYVSYSFN